MKIYSCSQIDIHLRNKGRIVPFIGLTWQRKCSEHVLTVCEVDNGNCHHVPQLLVEQKHGKSLACSLSPASSAINHPFLFLFLPCYIFRPLLSMMCGSPAVFWTFLKHIVNVIVLFNRKKPSVRLEEWNRSNNDSATSNLLRQHLLASLYPDTGRRSDSLWIITIATATPILVSCN